MAARLSRSNRWPTKTVEEAKRLYMRGYTINRICKLRHMPDRTDTVYGWKAKGEWDDENEEIQIRRKEKRIEKISDKLAAMDVRQLDILFNFTNHISKHLEVDRRLDPMIIQNLMNAFDKIVKNERLIKGDVTERKEQTIDGDFSLESIIYASADVEYESDASEQDTDAGSEELQADVLQQSESLDT